jgi:hypothetical protein
MNPFNPYSNLSKCSSRVKTTCLLVSSTSPARKTSSKMAYTCKTSADPLYSSHLSSPHVSFLRFFLPSHALSFKGIPHISLYPLLPIFPLPNPHPPNKNTQTTYLIKIEHQVQLAHIPKKAIQHLHKEMYGLQVRKLVIVRVDARTEEESCVAPVDDLVVAELDEVGLVFLVSGGDEAVDL